MAGELNEVNHVQFYTTIKHLEIFLNVLMYF
jgi:hypothetical protein